MNDLAREKLAKLIFIHGDAIFLDAQRCESLLREACPDCRREIGVLVEAHKAGVVARLRESAGTAPTPSIVEELARLIQNQMPVTDESARWAVQTWAGCMGSIDRAGSSASSRALPAGSAPPSVGGWPRPLRFVRLLLWSLFGGPLYALLLLLFCWAVLPGLFLGLGALVDLIFGQFSAEALQCVKDTLSAIWEAMKSNEPKNTLALFSGPAKKTATLWVWSLGFGASVILFTPVLAWRSMWSGPARSVGGTLIVLPYLAGLGGIAGGLIGTLAAGRDGGEIGTLIGAIALGLVGLICGLVGWGRALFRASRR
jgi:hypothetical protein